MTQIWQKIGFLACLGFTALMAGANLAHMTSTAAGAPVMIFGLAIPHKVFMGIGAVCVDVAIIISPFALYHWHRSGHNSAFFVVLAIWLICSGLSINSVHDWLAESAANAAVPAAQQEKRSRHAQDDLKRARDRLADIQNRLLTEQERDKRRILKEEEKSTNAAIAELEAIDWKAVVVNVEKPDDMLLWAKAFGLWLLSVGSWIGFMGGDGGKSSGRRDEKWEGMWDGKPSQAWKGRPSHADEHVIGSDIPVVNHYFPPSPALPSMASHAAPPLMSPQSPKTGPATPSQNARAVESDFGSPVASLENPKGCLSQAPGGKVGGKVPGAASGKAGKPEGKNQGAALKRETKKAPRPENVIDLRPADGKKERRLSEDEAVELAIRLRRTDPPTSWPKIAEKTGWPQSTIHRKVVGRGVG